MNKKVVKIIIVVITAVISAGIIFLSIKNQKYEINTVNAPKNIKLSMIKIEDGEPIIIKEVPEDGNWIMTYNCEEEGVQIFWEESTRKLYIIYFEC